MVAIRDGKRIRQLTYSKEKKKKDLASKETTTTNEDAIVSKSAVEEEQKVVEEQNENEEGEEEEEEGEEGEEEEEEEEEGEEEEEEEGEDDDDEGNNEEEYEEKHVDEEAGKRLEENLEVGENMSQDSSDDDVDDSQPLPPEEMFFSPTEYIKTCKIPTRCQVTSTVQYVEKFPEELKWFRRHRQFKHVFHMPKEPNHMLQGMWMLLVRTVKTEMREECWFVVNGVPIRYSMREHALLTGFACHEYLEN